jgi:hypothetical protein
MVLTILGLVHFRALALAKEAESSAKAESTNLQK